MLKLLDASGSFCVPLSPLGLLLTTGVVLSPPDFYREEAIVVSGQMVQNPSQRLPFFLGCLAHRLSSPGLQRASSQKPKNEQCKSHPSSILHDSSFQSRPCYCNAYRRTCGTAARIGYRPVGDR